MSLPCIQAAVELSFHCFQRVDAVKKIASQAFCIQIPDKKRIEYVKQLGKLDSVCAYGSGTIGL
jgi:hypothetical protein